MQKQGFRIGRLFEIDIVADWSWTFIAALMTLNVTAAFHRWHSGWSWVGSFALACLAMVLFFASLLAHEFGCDDNTCFMMEMAARLHDVGKIGVPDAILLKPDKLNAAEQEVMRSHSTVGAELLSKSNIPHMQMAEEIARHHHEWWDGSGYPARLSGSAIPLAARITALADVFDALTHKRPYKPAWPIDTALSEIERLKGRQFEPELADRFIVLVAALRRQHSDLDAFLGAAAKNSPFLQARARIWQVLEKGKDETASGSRLDLQR